MSWVNIDIFYISTKKNKSCTKSGKTYMAWNLSISHLIGMYNVVKISISKLLTEQNTVLENKITQSHYVP